MIIRRAGWGRYFLTVAIGLTSASEAAAEADVETWTSPTFECLSVYHNSRDGDIGPCSIRYRAAGADEWREGYPLVYDGRDRQYRGSLVGLTPDTEYEIELILRRQDRSDGRSYAKRRVFPIGKTVYLDDGERGEPLVITESGTPDGWLW